MKIVKKSNKQRYFHLGLCIVLVFFTNCNTVKKTPQESVEKTIRFGIIADPQYADREDKGARHYRASLAKLDTAISYFNRLPVNFTVLAGDLVDLGIKDLPPVMQRLSGLKHPVYNLLGNHDYEWASDKDNLYKEFNMKAPYYTFEKGNWLFVALNTNELAKYATNPGTSAYSDWEAMNGQLQKEGRKNARVYNGGISKEQLQWMENQLKHAAQTAKNVVVFTHHPLFPENGLEALNNREILAVIEKYPNVKAVISGHHHPGNFAYYKGIPMVTLEGMVETDQNAFGVVELTRNQIEIIGKGRLTSRTFKF